MRPVQLKKIVTLILFGLLFAFTPIELKAQIDFQEKTTDLVEEDEGPLMFKFEPDFLNAEEQRKEDIQLVRAIIDTMTISEGKRKRLLRDLYKNGISKRLSKVMMVDTKFEDPVENEN